MRIKIISDGQFHHTKVVNAETGEALENVTEIEWSIGNDGLDRIAECTLKLIDVEAELGAEVFDDPVKDEWGQRLTTDVPGTTRVIQAGTGKSFWLPDGGESGD